MTDQVEVIELEPQPAAVVRGRVETSEIPGFLGAAYGEVMRALGEQHQAPAGPPFARYQMREGAFDVVAGFPVVHPIASDGKVDAEVLPGGLVATQLYRGDYATIATAYDNMNGWLTANGYVAAGVPWESYLDEPGVAEPRTILRLPCVRR